jgi:hypothetical protein
MKYHLFSNKTADKITKTNTCDDACSSYLLHAYPKCDTQLLINHNLEIMDSNFGTGTIKTVQYMVNGGYAELMDCRQPTWLSLLSVM